MYYNSPALKTTNIKPGESFGRTFHEADRVEYPCMIHPAMEAKVEVRR